MSDHESGGAGIRGIRRVLAAVGGTAGRLGLAVICGAIIAANLFALRGIFVYNTVHGVQLIGSVLISVILIGVASYGLLKL